MTDWMEKMMDQLDQDQPSWYIDWAEQQSLRQFARSLIEDTDAVSRHAAIRVLRISVANRMFHRVINCAISQSIVSVPQKEPAK